MSQASATLALAPACPPWCSEHFATVQVCEADPIPAADGEIRMCVDPDAGILVSLYCQTDGLSLEQAEQIAHAILAMASRTTTTPSPCLSTTIRPLAPVPDEASGPSTRSTTEMIRQLRICDGTPGPSGMVAETWTDRGRTLYQVRWAGTGIDETGHLSEPAFHGWLNRSGYTCPDLQEAPVGTEMSPRLRAHALAGELLHVGDMPRMRMTTHSDGLHMEPEAFPPAEREAAVTTWAAFLGFEVKRHDLASETRLIATDRYRDVTVVITASLLTD